MQSENAPSLNLALLGYGKMGKGISQLAPLRGFEVRLVVTSESSPAVAGAVERHSIVAEDFQDIDVCLDFTTPAAVEENVRKVAALGCNLVVGTTGWSQHFDEVRRVVEGAGIGMVYAANFSIGVQLFYRAAEAAARIFAGFPMYQPYITETHHRSKKDAPSGTALEIEKCLQAAAPRAGPQEIPVSSVRAGYAPGTHELGFDSESDTVILRHTARSRQGFAEGTLYAARWVVGKKGLFSFADVLTDL
ncbi:MAG TPA: 4-hydroxy-tetrahydrodipicolinate reductase [Terriglobia bacterium]|nr:4-hydroxy-tetrahydrodipicolinate reductase [Terriglobia bacterium]